MKNLKTVRGIRPLCFFEESIIFSKNNSIYISDLDFLKIRKLTSLNNGLLEKIIFSNRILTRIFRYGPNNALSMGNGDLFISSDGAIYKIGIFENEAIARVDHKFRKEMRNCLSLSTINNISNFDDLICYGEYFNNPDQMEVHIWAKKISQSNWRIVHTFKAGLIEHIHAIVPDHIRGVVWILTGDFNDSAGFWMARNNFEIVEPVAIGRQEFRACLAFPIDEGIVYATDSQFEYNSIRILKHKNNKWISEFIYPLEGSCIHACCLNNDFVFSTSVEPGEMTGNIIMDLFDYKPGPGIKSSNSEIVIGNIEKGFRSIKKCEKDYFPLRLCQFGSITFPTGINLTNRLYAYGIALKGIDGKTFTIEIDS